VRSVRDLQIVLDYDSDNDGIFDFEDPDSPHDSGATPTDTDTDTDTDGASTDSTDGASTDGTGTDAANGGDEAELDLPRVFFCGCASAGGIPGGGLPAWIAAGLAVARGRRRSRR
jgi:hypothetical protein